MLAPLSSKNTSRSAGTPASRWGHCLLCSATSGRDCSAACSVFFTAQAQPGEPQIHGGGGPVELCAQFGQRRVRLLGDQPLQALPAAGRQQRLAATPVSLRFQRPAGFEVLAHPPHGGNTVAEAGGDFGGALALVVKVKYPLTHRNWNGFHAKTLPSQQPTCKLHYLWKRSSVTLPDSLVSIANGVFYQCTALTNVTFGNHLATIGDSTFYNCYNLTQLIFPSTVTNLGATCFQSCYGVQEIYFRGNAPSVGNGVFLAMPYATVYYFPGTTNWSSFLGGRPTALWDPHILTDDPTFGMSAGRFGFTVTNMVDIRVIIEATTNLAGTNWTQVQNSTTLNQSLHFSEPDWATLSKRFYRLSSP